MKVLKVVAMVVFIVIILFGIFLLVLTVTEFKPEEKEELVVENQQIQVLPSTFDLCLWNIGYGALSQNEDFFMDGGEKARPDSKEVVQNNFKEITLFLKQSNADVILLQEVDKNSKRSYYYDELEELRTNLKEYANHYGINYQSLYVPVPFPPMGKVNSGIASFSKYQISKAVRNQFVGNYSWPISLFQLKRCFVESYFSVEGKSNQLVVMNTHNSAFDKGGFLRKQQLEQLKETMMKHYEEGKYVIVAGDWNHSLPGVDENYFASEQKRPDWLLNFPEDWTPENWNWAYDEKVASVRTLDIPYQKGVNYLSIIDGILASPNVIIESAETLEMQFQYSDHQPSIYKINLQ